MVAARPDIHVHICTLIVMTIVKDQFIRPGHYMSTCIGGDIIDIPTGLCTFKGDINWWLIRSDILQDFSTVLYM